MRCDCCPLCPIAEDDICPESEGEYGIEHADGMLGCKHPRNWAEKRSMEYADHLGEMGTDMGVEMDLSEEEISRLTDICKHMVGLDDKTPYHRHGKAFYKPYRNFYSVPAPGDRLLDKVSSLFVKNQEQEHVFYSLNDTGLKWLSRQLKITIKRKG